MVNLDNCTFGMEIEAGGMHRRTVLPNGNTWCTKDGSIINDKGIGNDPKGEYNLIGGEIQVKPCETEELLLQECLDILKITKCPEIVIPSTMHIHIKIPDFLDDKNIDIVKGFILWNQKIYPELAKIISKLPPMSVFTKEKYPNPLHLKQVKRAYNDKYRSRHSIFNETIEKIIKNSNAKSIDDLINSLAPQSKEGKPLWSIFKRTGVNFKKMRKCDIGTIEFRMFSATTNEEEIKNIIAFPKQYINFYLESRDKDYILDYFSKIKYPEFYNWLDDNEEYSLNHLYTDHDKLERKEIIQYLKGKLLERKITLSDLGYPEFWVLELGKDYKKIYEYSRSFNEKDERTNN